MRKNFIGTKNTLSFSPIKQLIDFLLRTDKKTLTKLYTVIFPINVIKNVIVNSKVK